MGSGNKPREFQHELVVVDKVVRRTYCMKDKFAGRLDQEIPDQKVI